MTEIEAYNYRGSDNRINSSRRRSDSYASTRPEDPLDPAYAELLCNCVDEETAELFAGFDF